MEDGLKKALLEGFAAVINETGAENLSNTPDFILAEYLVNCLEAFNQTSNQRSAWYDREE
jgi:hypothetical protein